jgi:hypothetical protein
VQLLLGRVGVALKPGVRAVRHEGIVGDDLEFGGVGGVLRALLSTGVLQHMEAGDPDDDEAAEQPQAHEGLGEAREVQERADNEHANEEQMHTQPPRHPAGRRMKGKDHE